MKITTQISLDDVLDNFERLKIIDKNDTTFEVYGLVPNGRGLLNGISSLLVHGKFEGNIVNLVDEE
ncbi:hypothetical protein [Ligilactobacillus salivarius]|uniref:hypothetical protein n=1 Tax=Ligilactobacillus salivarius TaxID=1624 RepID=UPI0009DA0813|nr:hypothetical protein [Ligilactobacillus salivarius]OQQ78417.1 hypothetical protein B6U62_08730 [Ligilactobacillus salivarius]